MAEPATKDDIVPNPSEKPNILLVEDTAELRDAVYQQLDALGYTCTCAASCDEARQFAAENTYGCALIDIGLPDGTGLELLADIAEAAPQTVSIILTGDAKSDSIIQAMRTGAFDYLLKPIDLMTLRTSVARAITHHEAIRDRAMLVDLLKDERDHLRERVEAATADIRRQAEHLEASNAMLHALLDLSQLSSRLFTAEDFMRLVFETVDEHVPLEAIALADVAHQEFLGATRAEPGSVSVVTSKESEVSGASAGSGEDPHETYIVAGLRQYLNIDAGPAQVLVFEQEFWGRPVCSVAMLLKRGCVPDDVQREFLEMCAHFVAFEWQRARLLLHGAQQAGLGNIAQELAKTFLQALTAVRTTTEVLAESAADDDEKEGLAIIGKHATFLAEQAQAFHKLAQVRSDSVETVRIADYIDQTLNLLTNAIEQRGVDIQKDFRDDGECTLLNGAALANTFLDLISTAVRAIRAEGVLRLRLIPYEDDHILCEIAHEVADRQFYGSNGTRGALSITDTIKAHPRFMLAQRTVQTCGGSLTVERQGENRSAFKIVLPRNGLDVQKG